MGDGDISAVSAQGALPEPASHSSQRTMSGGQLATQSENVSISAEFAMLETVANCWHGNNLGPPEHCYKSRQAGVSFR